MSIDDKFSGRTMRVLKVIRDELTTKVMLDDVVSWRM